MPSEVDTPHEIEAANAWVIAITKGTSIHGLFRQLEATGPFPLVSAGLHCTECNHMAGGALDFSGEVGSTDGVGAARALMRNLAEGGCTHAAAICATFPPVDPDPSE